MSVSHKFTDMSKQKFFFKKPYFSRPKICVFLKKNLVFDKKKIFFEKIFFFVKKIFVFLFVLKKSIDSFNIDHKDYKKNYFHNFRPLSADSYGVEKRTS